MIKIGKCGEILGLRTYVREWESVQPLLVAGQWLASGSFCLSICEMEMHSRFPVFIQENGRDPAHLPSELNNKCTGKL